MGRNKGSARRIEQLWLTRTTIWHVVCSFCLPRSWCCWPWARECFMRVQNYNLLSNIALLSRTLSAAQGLQCNDVPSSPILLTTRCRPISFFREISKCLMYSIFELPSVAWSTTWTCMQISVILHAEYCSRMSARCTLSITVSVRRLSL